MNDVGGAQGAAERGRPAGAPRVPGLVLLRRIGAGAHGEVWLAADIVAGDRVAVKVRRGPPGAFAGAGADAGVGEDAGAGRLSREIAVLRRIDDPHVVRLRRVVDLPTGGRALVMDLAAGGSLAELVAVRGALDVAEVCTTIVPIARTLVELHRRGVVHGDLSPANVLFSGNGRPMIADLGCAVVLGARADTAWGADGYSDPLRLGPATPADDVYALGALIRFALTGDPADGRSSRTRADALVDGLLALAQLCTAADPARRPSPDVVAGTIRSTTPSAPVRLVHRIPDEGQAPGGRPVPLGVAPGGAAARGWTRPAPADSVPTVAIPPPTSIDLLIAGSGRPGGAAGGQGAAEGAAEGDAEGDAEGTALRVTASTAVTRRRTPPAGRSADPGGTAGRACRDGGRGRRAARPARPEGGRQQVRQHMRWRVAAAATVLLAAVGGVGLALGGHDDEALAGGAAGRRPARPGSGPSAPVPAAGPPSAPDVASAEGAVSAEGVTSGGRSAGTSGGWDDGEPRGPSRSPSVEVAPRAAVEPVAGAVSRLARGRAAAFATGSARPLDDVDEPGSQAMAADAALVSRLRDLRVRLDGLRFEVGEVRQLPGGPGPVLVETTVTTSAHRQVTAGSGAVRAMVPASSRRVVLALVPSPDRRRWLVRSVSGQEKP